MLRTVLVPVDKLDTARAASEGEVKRLSDKPCVFEFEVPDGRLEIAARSDDRPHVVGPFVLEDAS